MADVTIATQDAAAGLSQARSTRCLVYTTASIGYFVYVDTNDDLVYQKSTDGGATWGGAVTVRTGVVAAFTCWFDQWTSGDSGTIIHIWYLDPNVVYYRTLDTSSDTLGTERTVESSISITGAYSVSVSGAKMRGGNLYLLSAPVITGTNRKTYRSTDGGVNWSVRTNALENATSDNFAIFPGNEADNQDAWVLYQDASVNELTLKVIDDSADTVSESANIVSITENLTDGTGQYQFSGAIRHSDGHLILAAWTELDTATADLVVYDVNGTASIVAKTNIATNTDDSFYPSVFIDQSTDDIYVAHVGKSDGTETMGTSVKIYYAKSTDGGANWSADNAYSQDAASTNRQTWVPPSGYRFAVAWRNTSSFVAQTNYVNSLDLTPAAGGITGPLVGAGHLSGSGPLVGGRLVG